MKLYTNRTLAIAGLTALLLAGCGGGSTNTQTGAVAGSVLGGVIGHQFGKGDGQKAATILGAIVGGYIGGNIGAQMDAQDQSYVANSLASGRSNSWQNPNTGNSYTVRPGPVYQEPRLSTVCRPATIEGMINGRMEQIQMRACRGPNGQWQSAN